VFYENLLILYNFLCLNLLAFKGMKIGLNDEIKRKRKLNLVDLEGQVLCLRTHEGSKPRSSGYKLRLICFCVFFISFEKVYNKSQVANKNWFVFF